MNKRLYINDKVKLEIFICYDGSRSISYQPSPFKKGEIFKIKSFCDGKIYLCTKHHPQCFNIEEEIEVSCNEISLYKRPLLNKIANFFNLGINNNQ